MTEKANHIARLLSKRLQGEATTAELNELQEWMIVDPRRIQLLNDCTDADTLSAMLAEYYSYNNDIISDKLNRVFSGVHFAEEYQEEKPGRPAIVHRVHFLKTAWFRYAAAIVILFGVGAYLYTSQQKKKHSSPEIITKEIKNDVQPGRERALLTLSDGSTIVLDSAANGRIAVQQGSSVIKKDGNILYDPNQVNNKEVVYNTMSTPRGGQYQLTLPDGTQVWLNAASSITYPTAFIEKQRKVKITGEVYFEIKKNAAKPFIVQTYKDEIKVLGTRFNVNAYVDEPVIKTSLSEGAVQIGKSVLQPGQAYINGRVVETNLSHDLAWKNGEFNFEDLNVQQAMRQIGRWYDIEIVYQGSPPDIKFFGTINRAVTLSTVLKALGMAGVKFKLEGSKLIVE